MKAVVMTATGGADVLQVQELPAPTLRSPHDVLIRLHAAGVNPVDTKLRSKGTYRPEQATHILGCDGAGVVEAIGSAVTRVQPGDAVWYCYGGIGGPQGNYAQQAVIDENLLAHKPAALDFATAAAGPLVLITAWEALHDRARLQAGQTVLIHAGAGGVGHVAIQLAKAAGCTVITTVSSDAKADLVRALGADHVINYRNGDFVAQVLQLTGGQGVDIAFDTVGGAIIQQTFAAVRPYGDLVSLLQPDASIDWKIARLRNLRFSLELMLSPMYYGWSEALRHHGWILEQCSALADQGRLKIHVAHALPLVQAAAAHRLIEAGGMTGKIVLLVDE